MQAELVGESALSVATSDFQDHGKTVLKCGAGTPALAAWFY